MTDDRTEATRHLYATVASTYDEMLPDTRYEAPLELGMLDHFIRELPESGLPVLDAGCGTGRMIRYLSSRGVQRVIGIDLSPEMVEFARAGNPGVSVEVGDLRSLPLGDGSVSAMLCWYSIIHSTEPEVVEIAGEARRVLAPGAPILFGFQAGTGERRVERAYGHDVTLHGVLHEPDAIAALLTAAGFEVTATARRAPIGVERNGQGLVMARRA